MGNRKFRKMLTMTLVLAMTAALTACGQEKAQKEEKTEKEPEETVKEDPAENLFWNQFDGGTSEGLYVCQAQSFSEGATWITLKDPGKADQTMLIDEKGNVLYKRPLLTWDEERNRAPELSEYTNFSHGVSFLSDENDQVLVNTDGEVVWSVSEDGWKEAERLFGEGSVEDVTADNDTLDDRGGFFNGYLEVSIDVNTFEHTGTMEGILKPDGTWLVEPQEITVHLNSDWNVAAYDYQTANGRRGTKAIRLETGEIYDGGQTEAVAGQFNDLTDVVDHSILNDFTQESFNDIDEWGNDQSAQVYVRRWLRDDAASKQEGLLYDEDQKAFMDKDWNKVIDLSEYHFITSQAGPYDPSEFKDGYSFLPIKNPDGAPYFTLIDKSGQRVFEPVKYPDGITGYCAYVTGDRFLITNTVQPQFYAFAAADYQVDDEHVGPVYYDLSGKPLSISYPVMYPYADGIALVADENEHYMYIDEEGNELFARP